MGRPPAAQQGESRKRLLDAALALFAAHGMGGTSLQMIADHLGVTKAAVYHQFNSKAEIVVAAAAPALGQIEQAVSAAEAAPDARDGFEAMLDGLVELVLDHRAFAASLQRDGEIGRLLEEHARFLSLKSRMDRLLIGENPAPDARVALATAGGGLMVAGIDRALADIDRETLRRVLRASARATLEPYAPAATTGATGPGDGRPAALPRSQ
ncbi:TetR/AcrR family transcriptional regulator [Herbiconiux sp. 11R-BC]|uniref:TetR/AcrR family transcriptional regulator n=1 Tax=Herbiconiux sp. 11R-BC TaxID=3111637 RepID=UPI003C06FE3E